MFIDPIIKRLQNRVQSTVSHMSGNIAALAPLLVAATFGIMAASHYLNEMMGPLAGYLTLAGVFLVISLVVYVVARWHETHQMTRANEELAAMAQTSPLEAVIRLFQSSDVPQSLLASAKSAAPAAARTALREAPRNLPLLLGAGLGLMLASRLLDALNDRSEDGAP